MTQLNALPVAAYKTRSPICWQCCAKRRAVSLISIDAAKRLGFIGICDTKDLELSKCEAWMAENAANAERLDLTSRRYFHGKAGPAVKWKIWIVGPERPDEEDEK